MNSVAYWCIILAFLGGCASQISPKLDAQYQQATAKTFEDELDSFRPLNAEEMAVKEILRKIKVAYETCDKTLLTTVFSEDYLQAVFLAPSNAIRITRAEYFSGLAMGKITKNECDVLKRQLSMAKIRLAKPEESADRIDVVLLTTYASKYFNPRFMETFSFSRRNGKMVVQGRVIAPLYPKSAEYYQADIYIGDISEFEKRKVELRQMAWEDGDILIDRILGGTTYQTLPVDYNPKSVIVVFREPPPQGAKVKIAHWYYNSRGGLQSTFEQNHTVERVNPWFFLVTQSTIFAEGNVTYEAFLDGTKILERSYRTE